MYTLYFAPGAASMVVHVALVEAGAPYQLELVDLGKGRQRDPDYLRLNPHGVVPTLIVDGAPVSESAAILLLLSERHPQANLAPPPGSGEYARWLQWIAQLAVGLGSTYRLWFYPRDLGAQDHADTTRAALRRKIETTWDRIDSYLECHGPYLLGENFSAADLLLAMYLRWSRNMPRPGTNWPNLLRLADLVRSRPSWTTVCHLEGLTDWVSESMVTD